MQILQIKRLITSSLIISAAPTISQLYSDDINGGKSFVKTLSFNLLSKFSINNAFGICWSDLSR